MDQSRKIEDTADQLRNSEHMGHGTPTASFVKYQPTLAGALPIRDHPCDVVESASLAAIPLPVVTYKLATSVRECFQLSSLQLEAILLAGHAHTTFLNSRRHGILIGDGAGVGKGRIISGIIKDNFHKKRGKSIWMTKSKSLYDDAARDFASIGHSTKLLKPFHEFYNNRGTNSEDFCLFVTYAEFYRHREDKVQAILSWLGNNFRGVVILDECHLIKNLKTNASKAVRFLDEQMPNARFVYSSATASEQVDDICYLQRLHLWGPGTSYPQGFSQMQNVLKKVGVLGMELIAMELKSRGAYVARRLDFSKATFSIVEVKLDKGQTKLYNDCVAIWSLLLQRATMKYAEDRQFLRIYWAQHQLFFKQICICFKLKTVCQRIRTHLANGKSVIVGLQSTGDVLSSQKLNSYKCLVSTLERKLLSMTSYCLNPGPEMKAIIRQIRKLKLPPNPLDYLIDKLGHRNVSELTGRKQRIIAVESESGSEYRWCPIPGSKNSRIANFMCGKTKVAIISEACSTGLSLHSASYVANQTQRIHMTIELPWSAEQIIQQCGRSLRTGQISAPHYELVVVDCGGEVRFGSSVANRMCALGAITQGDRGFTINGVEKFLVDSIYANDAVKYTLKTITKEIDPMIRYPDTNMIQFFKRAFMALLPTGIVKLTAGSFTPTSKSTTVDKFLNRLLGVTLPEQNIIFKYFMDLYQHTIQCHKNAGCYEMGIRDYGRGRLSRTIAYLLPDESRIKIYSVVVDTGISFENAHKIFLKSQNSKFYLGKIGPKRHTYLAIQDPESTTYSFLFPFGLLPSKQTDPHFNNHCILTTPMVAKRLWNTNYKQKHCYHVNSQIPCPEAGNQQHCELGNRYKICHVLTGLLWSNLFTCEALLRKAGLNALQLVRCSVKNSQGERNILVGVHVPSKLFVRVVGQLDNGAAMLS